MLSTLLFTEEQNAAKKPCKEYSLEFSVFKSYKGNIAA